MLLLLWHFFILPSEKATLFRLRELGPFIAILTAFPGALLEKLHSAIKSNVALVVIKWNFNKGILKIIFIIILFCQVIASSGILLENYHHRIRAEQYLVEYEWGRKNLPKDEIILVPGGFSYFYAWYLDKPVIFFKSNDPIFPSLLDIQEKSPKFIARYLSERSIRYIWSEERGAAKFPQWFLNEIDSEPTYFVLIHSNKNNNLQVYEIISIW